LEIRAILVEGDSQFEGILANIARDTYNPMEMADALAIVDKKLGGGATDEELASRIGKARNTVVEYKSLLKLPPDIQDKARKDSCVPFRKLRVLARDKKKSEPVKIAEYDKLHTEYTAKKQKDKKKKTKTTSAQTRGTRSVVAVRKKLEGMKSTLDSFQYGEKVDNNEKSNLLKSMQEIIDAANAAITRLK